MTRRTLLALPMLLSSAAGSEQHRVTGVVLQIDRAHRTFTASCAAIPGYMEAMSMSFDVRSTHDLASVEPGQNVEFTLTVDRTRSYASNIHPVPFESMEQEPLRARRLQLLQQGGEPVGLKRGESVPDFTLIDQTGAPVSLSSLRGKVIALNFIYTACPLPDYCFRLANQFSGLAKRFAGRNVSLLSVSFDPVHDTPTALATYARTFKADPHVWHFLTGELHQVKAVCRTFGLNFWQDEGVLTHSLRTIVIAPDQTVAATFDGNRFTAGQLGDFLQTLLK